MRLPRVLPVVTKLRLVMGVDDGAADNEGEEEDGLQASAARNPACQPEVGFRRVFGQGA